MICPHCKRPTFERRDVLYAAVDGAMRCRACGSVSRLDLFSRWVISIMIAVTLPSLLLYGNVFYSGHLFVVSMIVIVVGWRAIAAIGLPIFSLERSPHQTTLRPKQSAFVLSALLAGALAMDGFMYSRFETEPIEQAGGSEAIPRDDGTDPLRIRPREERERAAKFSL